MSDLVQAVMPDGTTLWVRVEDDEAGPVDTGFGRSVGRRLDDLPQTIETITRSVRAGLRSAAPDEVSLEFGIELAGKTGQLVSVLTEAGAKATLKVSVTWRKGEPPETSAAAIGTEDEDEGEDEDEDEGEGDGDGDGQESADAGG